MAGIQYELPKLTLGVVKPAWLKLGPRASSPMVSPAWIGSEVEKVWSDVLGGVSAALVPAPT